MLSDIRDDQERLAWVNRLKEIIEILVKQEILPREARISGEMLVKLNKLHDYLENEIMKYDKISRMH